MIVIYGTYCYLLFFVYVFYTTETYIMWSYVSYILHYSILIWPYMLIYGHICGHICHIYCTIQYLYDHICLYMIRILTDAFHICLFRMGRVCLFAMSSLVNVIVQKRHTTLWHSKMISASNCLSRDLRTTPFDLILHFFSLILTTVHLCAKFEVSNFNRSRDITVTVTKVFILRFLLKDRKRSCPKIPKVGHVTPQETRWPNFADFGYFSQFSICVSNLTRIASSRTDIWLFYDFADLAAKYLFGPILGSFFADFDP